MSADSISTEIAIVGAGIAGIGVAASLDPGRDVVVLEQEATPGYHSTGRSAAIFIQNYGNSVIRRLSRASAPLFANADPSYFPTPLLSQRGILYVADKAGMDDLAELLAEAEGLEPMELEAVLEKVPLLSPDWLHGAAYEHDAQDIDVNALHQGWLKLARAKGVRILATAPLASAVYRDGRWLIEAGEYRIEARTIVNAAGAWADDVAARCGAQRIGLQPMRRSIAVLPVPSGFDCSRWPLVADAAETWYIKPEAGRLLVSPADEDPVDPHDAFADDMVLAEGLHRFEQATTQPVTRVESSWAGLRTFAPDRTPVAGFDPAVPGFFWLAGQGGYGIQTSPALSQLAAYLIDGKVLDAETNDLATALSPERFRQAAAAK